MSITQATPQADTASPTMKPAFRDLQAPAEALVHGELLHVLVSALIPSRTNPRKTFSEAHLAELAASIASQGILAPLLVRAVPPSRLQDTATMKPRPEWEIIAGERRYRASLLAKLTRVPVLVRTGLTDAQVIEAQLVENLQRDDLHPLEEAEGYQALIDATGTTKEAAVKMITERINRSRTYVFNRLKLLSLQADSRKAFSDGRIDTSRADLLATIGDPKLQAKVLVEALRKGYNSEPSHSLRSLREWVERNIMLKMDSAPFDTKSASLVAGCGACTKCPKRTKADRDLFAAFDGPDMCTDPACWDSKSEAHLAVITVRASEEGLEVIAGKQAKELKPYSYSDTIKGMTRLEEKVAGADGKSTTTVAKVIKDTEVKPVVFVDPHTQQAVKLVPTDELRKALKAKGLVTESQAGKAKVTEAQQREKLKLKVENTALERGQAAVSERLASGLLHAFSARVLRVLLLDTVQEANGDGEKQLLAAWHLPLEVTPAKKHERDDCTARLRAHALAAADDQLGVMLLQALMFTEYQGYMSGIVETARGGKHALLQALAADCEVDLEAIRREVAKELKPAPKVTKAPAKRQDPPGASLPAAPQGSIATNGAKGAGATSKAAAGNAGKHAARPKRISAAEAKQGIADAMQGVAGPGGSVGAQEASAA